MSGYIKLSENAISIKPLDTFDMNLFFNKIKHSQAHYLGCFPSDKIPLPTFHEPPFGFILNLDESDLPGSHWIAIFSPIQNHAYYYDPLGKAPDGPILKYLNAYFKTYQFSTSLLQNPFSNVCGYHALAFLLLAFKGLKFETIIETFNKSKNQADKLVVSLVLAIARQL